MGRGVVTDEYVSTSVQDFTSGKYKATKGTAGNNPQVRIYYVDGRIDADRTYTEKYCRQHKLGKYAEKASEQKPKKEKKQKSGGKGYFGMSKWNPLHWLLWLLVLPFRLLWRLAKQALKLLGIAFILQLLGVEIDGSSKKS